MEDIQKLKNRIEYLEKENQYLKSWLDDVQITYDTNLNMVKVELFDSDQGARIIQRNITSDDTNKFFIMFWGRTDVYGKRIIKKSTGEVNYFTQQKLEQSLVGSLKNYKYQL